MIKTLKELDPTPLDEVVPIQLEPSRYSRSLRCWMFRMKEPAMPMSADRGPRGRLCFRRGRARRWLGFGLWWASRRQHWHEPSSPCGRHASRLAGPSSPRRVSLLPLPRAGRIFRIERTRCPPPLRPRCRVTSACVLEGPSPTKVLVSVLSSQIAQLCSRTRPLPQQGHQDGNDRSEGAATFRVGY